MTEYLNAYKNFNKLLSTESSNRITKTKDIMESISIQLPDRVDSIKEEKLKIFRDTMSYVYEIFILNPYTIGEKTCCPFLSDELLFVHYRMLCFLLNRNFITITHKANSYKFNWNIPKPFMPILTAYILAANTSPRKFADANSFFDRFNSYILSDKRVVVNTKNASSQLTNSVCEGWLIYELGKYYFCNLESFIHNVAVTPYKIRMVYQTLAPLTNTLLFTKKDSGLVTHAVNALFLHFRKQYLSNENDSGLFDHIEPFTVSGEQNIINYCIESAKNAFDSIASFVTEYAKLYPYESIFPIAVSDYDHWVKIMDELISELKKHRKSLKSTINKYYADMHSELFTILRGGAKDLLYINGNNLKFHSDFLINTLSTYFHKLESECRAFKKKVYSVSQGNTKNRDNSELTMYQIEYFIEGIQQRYTGLQQKIDKDFYSLPPYTAHICRGTINDYAVSNMLETPEQLLQIWNIIFPDATYKNPADCDTLSQITLPLTLKSYFDILSELIPPKSN